MIWGTRPASFEAGFRWGRLNLCLPGTALPWLSSPPQDLARARVDVHFDLRAVGQLGLDAVDQAVLVLELGLVFKHHALDLAEGRGHGLLEAELGERGIRAFLGALGVDRGFELGGLFLLFHQVHAALGAFAGVVGFASVMHGADPMLFRGRGRGGLGLGGFLVGRQGSSGQDQGQGQDDRFLHANLR